MLRGVHRHLEVYTLLRFKERVRQRDRIHQFHLGVVHYFRVDVEEHRHVHLLVRVQLLLLKAKALNFVEIRSRFKGNHIVGTNSYDWMIGWVLGCVKGQCRFPRNNLKTETMINVQSFKEYSKNLP